MDKRLTLQEVKKADTDLGLVFGFPVVSTIDSEPYYDLQGDYIPVDVVTKAFLAGDVQKSAKLQHDGADIGEVVFAMPIYKGMEIQDQNGREGLYIGMKVYDEDVLSKITDGELTGFSIGGKITSFEEAA